MKCKFVGNKLQVVSLFFKVKVIFVLIGMPEKRDN
jgi:hypothetical protein